jgi:amidase
MVQHQFTPRVYYNALGSYEPVLHLSSGDSVVTATVDNAGRDALDRPVASRPNPLTGPFYVEGAEPGDTLVVHFDHLWPNRRVGRSATVLAYNVVDPDFVPALPPRRRVEAEWALDLAEGTATLVAPSTRLGRLVLPMRPMVGCFGVAPAHGQAIASTTSGAHGGNMDYKGFVAGVTVHLPVFAPGGLFFLGDGHAVQGAGEIVGTGVEVSFDVQFTVDVRKGDAIAWPRGDDEAFLFTVGNARPLDQALQHATTEMLRWLQDGFGLDDHAAHILLGQCVEYEVGNVFDPAYTMVCKLRKALIPP